MNITIHRGASQIGGCITEISTDVAKIIIDLGSNLPGCQQADFTETEIARIVNGADAVLYTHYHGDHVGFISMVPETVRQYIGVGAQDVMRCKFAALNRTGEHQKDVDAVERMFNYEADKPLNFCDLRVTPYYCSHSAFDAYMFKIEWNGKVILHTGDFRKHGYMGNKLIPMHTSGHADICSLTEVCRTVNPKLAVIPIHKEKDSDFSSLPITEEQKSKVITSNVTIEGINICMR